MIVNGPITRELDINSGDNLFGPGWRANLTIGRALRLVMRNVCGSLPGLLDRGTLGHPGKVSYVIAENEAESPWTPLHVERGFRPEQSTVTVMAARGAAPVLQPALGHAEGVLTTLADAMRLWRQRRPAAEVRGRPRRRAHADHRGGGWGKEEIRQFLFEHTQNSLAHLKRTKRMPGAIQPGDETKMRAARGVARRHPGRRGGRARRPVLGLHPGLGQGRSSQAVTEDRHEGGQAMMELLDPTAEAATQTIAYVARPESLEGKRVGLIENTKFNSDRLLEKIGEILKPEYGVAETRMFRKHNAGGARRTRRSSRRSEVLRRHGRRRRRLRVLLVGQCARRNRAGEERRFPRPRSSPTCSRRRRAPWPSNGAYRPTGS